MTKKTRWIDNTIAEAETTRTRMPWERGLRRQAMIARRLENRTDFAKVTLPPLPVGMVVPANG